VLLVLTFAVVLELGDGNRVDDTNHFMVEERPSIGKDNSQLLVSVQPARISPATCNASSPTILAHFIFSYCVEWLALANIILLRSLGILMRFIPFIGEAQHLVDAHTPIVRAGRPGITGCDLG
jgi:hypothetical protein